MVDTPEPSELLGFLGVLGGVGCFRIGHDWTDSMHNRDSPMKNMEVPASRDVMGHPLPQPVRLSVTRTRERRDATQRERSGRASRPGVSWMFGRSVGWSLVHPAMIHHDTKKVSSEIDDIKRGAGILLERRGIITKGSFSLCRQPIKIYQAGWLLIRHVEDAPKSPSATLYGKWMKMGHLEMIDLSKWWFSIAMWVYQRVFCCAGRLVRGSCPLSRANTETSRHVQRSEAIGELKAGDRRTVELSSWESELKTQGTGISCSIVFAMSSMRPIFQNHVTHASTTQKSMTSMAMAPGKLFPWNTAGKKMNIIDAYVILLLKLIGQTNLDKHGIFRGISQRMDDHSDCLSILIHQWLDLGESTCWSKQPVQCSPSTVTEKAALHRTPPVRSPFWGMLVKYQLVNVEEWWFPFG